MSKRSHIDDAISRQFKKRITEREVDKNSKSIQEKTIQKLFAGARALLKGVDGNQNIEKPAKKNCSVCHCIADFTCWNCTVYLCPGCSLNCVNCLEFFCHDCCKNRESGESNRSICANCF